MAKMIKGIPALPVQKIDNGIKFYAEKFGFSVQYHNEGFTKLIRDEVEIHLWASYDDSWKNKGASLATLPICSGEESFLAGTASCRIEVSEIDILFKEYKTQKVIYGSSTFVEEQPWGTREFPALDLRGNLLTFCERIKENA